MLEIRTIQKYSVVFRILSIFHMIPYRWDGKKLAFQCHSTTRIFKILILYDVLRTVWLAFKLMKIVKSPVMTIDFFSLAFHGIYMLGFVVCLVAQLNTLGFLRVTNSFANQLLNFSFKNTRMLFFNVMVLYRFYVIPKILNPTFGISYIKCQILKR